MATTPSGNIITTGLNNAASTVTSGVVNTANVVTSGVTGIASGIIGGAVGQAIAPVIDITSKGKQVFDLVTNPTLGGALSLLGKGFPPYRNELDKFSSYNYIFTLGALTNLELNFPLSYRTVGPLIKIIKSGGTGGNKIPTIYELDGQVEFFIEDVEIQSHLAPNPGTRLSNATVIDFKVIEPYSMGQFFHSLRTAAMVAGHPNYLQAPFLLSIGFIGYDDDGNVQEPLFSKRHIPIKFVQADMDVSESGAVYDVKCVPYNESALTDEINSVNTDTVIKGRTVAEVLQTGAESLTVKLNTLEDAQVDAKQKPAADYYVISFPNDSLLSSVGLSNSSATQGATTGKFQQLYESIRGTGAEVPDGFSEQLQELSGTTTLGAPLAASLQAAANASINSIGAHRVNPSDQASATNPGNVAPGDAESEDEEGTMVAERMATGDADAETFTFRDGTAITDMIEDVITSSDWGRNAVRQQRNAKGEYEWFKIHTHVYNSSSLFGGLVTGASPKVYVFRVVPYTVPASIFSGPNTQGVWNALSAQAGAVKAYNYIYTGQNSEIIKFDLHFNQTFYTGMQATRSQRMMSQIFGGSMLSKEENSPEFATSDTGGTGVSGSETGSPTVLSTTENNQVSGGGGTPDTATSVAKTWNNNLINTDRDMITVDLEINGDPYWLMDAGLGNYLGLSNPINSAITLEGSCNPVGGMVTTVLNFRTPMDYDGKDGFVKYPLGGFLPIAMFSGVYRTIYVTNHFKNGKFTQTLNLARLMNQDLSPTALAGSLLSAFSGSSVGQAIGLGTDRNKMGGEEV
tara:strand:+ start:1859 stop:4258 length:2400 start_codon:yes stop_codon:yes gene_type:complete